MEMDTETGLELFTRLTTRPNVTSMSPVLLPFGNKGITEIYGPSSTGKTALLIDMIAHCILGSESGGCQAQVVLLDLDHQLDISRLARTLETLHKSFCGFINSDEQATSECLSRLHIVRCFTMDELFLSLYDLERTLLLRSRVGAVFIDSVSAFYWLTRFRFPTIVPQQNPCFAKLATVISRISRDFNLPFVVVRQKLFRNRNFAFMPKASESGSGDSVSSALTVGFADDFMGKTWHKLITVRISTSRRPDKTPSKFCLSVASVETKVEHLEMSVISDGIILKRL